MSLKQRQTDATDANIQAMLCPVGTRLMESFQLATQGRVDAHAFVQPGEKVDTTFLRRMIEADSMHRQAAEALLEHKLGCSICRTSDSEMRRRQKAQPPTAKEPLSKETHNKE